MLIEAFLRWLVIVWTYGEQTIYSAHVVGLAHLNDGSGVIAATSHEQRHTASHLLDDKLLNLVVLVSRETWSLASGSEDAKEVGTVSQLIVDDRGECVIIHTAVLTERCHKGYS